MPVVFFKTVFVSLPASCNAPCVLLASRLTSALVSRPAFFIVLLTLCATLFNPPGLCSSCAWAGRAAKSAIAATAAKRMCCDMSSCSFEGEYINRMQEIDS